MLVSESRGDTLEKPKRTLTHEELIERAMEKLQKDLDKPEAKGTVGDLIRLIQLQRDLGFDQPKKVTILWVEKDEK
jgi:hypothetical protein